MLYMTVHIAGGGGGGGDRELEDTSVVEIKYQKVHNLAIKRYNTYTNAQSKEL